jgi:cellulose biosynthesis protein BcsQ
MNKASQMAAISFTNHDLISRTLNEVEDDYDVCIMDCSPGRFLLHENIFQSADLLLVPNIPAPLSVYCNTMLMDELHNKMHVSAKILCFYNMVQAHKNLHRYYLDNRKKDDPEILFNYIPFYSEIELITLTKESIFHQLKEFRANAYYQQLWMEVCERMQWQTLQTKGVVVDLNKEENSSIQINTELPKASNS